MSALSVPSDARKVYPPLVGSLVREARRRVHWSQQQVADKVGKSKQWVAAAEAGRLLPPLDQLVAIYGALHRATGSDGATRLAHWLVEWLETNAAAAGARAGKEAPPEQRRLLHEALAALRSRTGAAPVAGGAWRSLDQFPEAFSPLTVVAADRRDQPPETRADLCILSGAVTDLTFLPKLPGSRREVSLRSDKLVPLGTDDMRRRELGRSNLLVVSSPASNWAARTINGSALFRYDVPEPAVRLDARIRTLTELDDSTLLRLLWRLIGTITESGGAVDLDSVQPDNLSVAQRDRLPRAKELARELLAFGTPQDILSQFSETGILDPVADRRYQLPGESFDYATISLAPNPFAEDDSGFVAILVSGMHGRGTAHALGALVSDPQMFARHPFGGTIQVHEQTHADWAERFLNADWEWRTPDYTPESLVERFEQALAAGPGQRPVGLTGLADDDLRARIAFVRSLATA